MNEVAAKEFTTTISKWTNAVTGLVESDFNTVGVALDEYSKQCAMNAMQAIYQLVKATDKANIADIDPSNLREIVGRCASLKLNAGSFPREAYFQLRNKKQGDKWVKEVEMGIEGDGYDALLRNFGDGIAKVYPVWLVKEGDFFTYPKHKGVTVVPPEWEEKGTSTRVTRVVYPISLKDGTTDYLIAERDSVKANLFAHVKQNLLNETFGIAESKYKANEKQAAEIQAKKQEIYDALRKCETVDDMLACEVARPYMSPAWLDSSEAMIVRKMRNNATKRYPKNMNMIANQSLAQMEESYKSSAVEIEANENAEPFVIEGTTVEQAECL